MAERARNSIAVYPGSFDPITLGHVDIIERLADFYGQMVVLVANSPSKAQLFTSTERVALIEKCVGHIPNVKADMFDGLTVDYARRIGATVVLRGLRAVADFEYEFAMANMNRKLAPEIETKIVFTRPEYSFVSSRTVKEVALFGGSVEGLVPPHVAVALEARIAAEKSAKKES